MAKTLGGKTAIVTGASSGIGGAIARALAAEGAEVYAAGRTETSLKGLVDEIRKADGKAHAAVIDVRDPVSINGLVDRAVKETGRTVSFSKSREGESASPPMRASNLTIYEP